MEGRLRWQRHSRIVQSWMVTICHHSRNYLRNKILLRRTLRFSVPDLSVPPQGSPVKPAPKSSHTENAPDELPAAAVVFDG